MNLGPTYFLVSLGLCVCKRTLDFFYGMAVNLLS